MKKLIHSVLIIVAYLICLEARPQSGNFNIDEIYPIEKSHSYVGFTVKYMGYAMVRGRFEEFKGTIRYDESDLNKTSVSFNIKTSSIDTDLEWRDNDLKSAQWLDTAQYPYMEFISTSIKINENGFDVIGDLTIKGITKSVVLNMNPPSGVLRDTRGDKQVIFTGNVTIDRTEFGVEGKRWSKVKEGITAVDNKVNIELSILGKQLQERNLSGWVRNEERPPGKVFKLINDQGAKKAMKEFETMAKESDRLNVNALRIVGRLLMMQGKSDDALMVFQQNAESFPQSYEAFNDLGEIYGKLQKFDKAMDSFKSALEIDSTDTYSREVIRQLDGI